MCIIGCASIPNLSCHKFHDCSRGSMTHMRGNKQSGGPQISKEKRKIKNSMNLNGRPPHQWIICIYKEKSLIHLNGYFRMTYDTIITHRLVLEKVCTYYYSKLYMTHSYTIHCESLIQDLLQHISRKISYVAHKILDYEVSMEDFSSSLKVMTNNKSYGRNSLIT